MNLTTNTSSTSESNPGPNVERATPLRAADLDSRKTAEAILARCWALPREDGEILRAIYERGQSAAQVARLLGRNSRVILRRARRLTARVRSPEFDFVLSNRNHWSPTRRSIATSVFIEGRRIKAAAAIARTSYHAARLHYFAILTVIDRAQKGAAA